jgi:nucleoside-diphosphate-sugar epimerase
MQRVLITGATGFIGRHLVQVMTRQGLHVRALVRSAAQAQVARGDGAEPQRGDLDDVESIKRASEGCDTCIHLAGLTRARNEAQAMRANAQGVVRVAEGLPQGAHCVLISSLAAMGPGTPGSPRRDDSVAQPVSAYGRSKLAGERALWEAVQRGVLASGTVLRPPMVYGPYDKDVLGIVRGVARGIALMPAGPMRSYSYAYGPDLANAIAGCAADPRTHGLSFNVGSSAPVTHVDLIAAMAAATDRRPITVKLPSFVVWSAALAGSLTGKLSKRPPILNLDKWREVQADGWVADSSRFEALLPGFFRTSLEEGLRETVGWARAEGLLSQA